MYAQYWGLTEKPFENTPDPRFIYYSPEHEEALSRLRYAVEERKGAGMLTGIFGCGKTVLIRALLTQLSRNRYQVGLINSPNLKSVELLRSIARQLGAENLPEKLNEMSTDYFLQVIEKILLNNAKDGKETLVAIDEAHGIIDNEVFEQLRLLLNFQFEDRFLFTLLLAGQPELSDRIKQNKQFYQRIAIGYNLGPLSEKNTASCIEHRLEVAGAKRQIFNPHAMSYIFQNSGGIPRRINQICDMCLIVGLSHKASAIDEKIAAEAVTSLGV
jgi:general secretion pathway protein A